MNWDNNNDNDDSLPATQPIEDYLADLKKQKTSLSPMQKEIIVIDDEPEIMAIDEPAIFQSNFSNKAYWDIATFDIEKSLTGSTLEKSYNAMDKHYLEMAAVFERETYIPPPVKKQEDSDEGPKVIWEDDNDRIIKRMQEQYDKHQARNRTPKDIYEESVMKFMRSSNKFL